MHGQSDLNYWCIVLTYAIMNNLACAFSNALLIYEASYKENRYRAERLEIGW